MFNGTWKLTGDGASGWAYADDSPPLWLELLADDEIIGICRADLAEPRNCGFWLPVPAAALEDGSELRIRIANTDQYLERENAPQKEDARPALIGDIAVDRGLTFSGWARDEARSEIKIPVFAFVDGNKVAETIAAERRYRPREAEGHGFSLELPETYADGASHVVELKDDLGRNLPGSPFRIRSLPKNAVSWLKSQKKLDKPLLNLLCGMFETMEERLPGILGSSRYEEWKKAFPVQAPAGKQKASLKLYGDNRIRSALLKNQQAVDLRLNSENPEFVLFPGAASALHPFALAQMLDQIRKTGADLVYADEEDSSGAPQFKPAWDREAFLAQDYLGPVLAKAEIVKKNGAQCTAANARFMTIMNAEKIRHLPIILSHASGTNDESRQDTLEMWLEENCPGASIESGRIVYPLPEKARISIIIPTRDQGDLLNTCLESLKQTDWPDYEIIIIDNGTREENALAVMRKASESQNVSILDKPGVFNYAQLNNDAALKASGKFLCFLNNDTEALNAGWLAELARMLYLDEAGCAGAKLLWPNGLVQHAGVVVGVHQLAAHAGNKWLDNEPGYMGRNLFSQQYSAVTAACMLTPRELFLNSGGFDGSRFPVAFNDVDYCLRLRERGKRVYWTPYSRLAHHESASRGKDISGSAKSRSEREMNFFRFKWGHYDDPFYNPNLPLAAAGEPFFGLAFPPRARETR